MSTPETRVVQRNGSSGIWGALVGLALGLVLGGTAGAVPGAFAGALANLVLRPAPRSDDAAPPTRATWTWGLCGAGLAVALVLTLLAACLAVSAAMHHAAGDAAPREQTP